MALTTLNRILDKTFNFLMACEFGESLVDTCQSVFNEKLTINEKVSRCGSNVIFIAAQGADFYATRRNELKAEEKLALRSAVSASSIMKQGVRLFTNNPEKQREGLLFGAVVLIRGADVASLAAELESSQLNGYLTATIKATLPLTKIIAQLFLPAAWLSNQPQLNNISKFQTIPDVFANNGLLTQFICRISKKPIRFAFVITQTQYDEKPVYYERDIIIQRFASGVKPPGWPEELEFDQRFISPSEFAQKLIDRTLEKLVQEISVEIDGVEINLL